MKEDFKKWLCELAEYGYKPHKLSWQLTYNMNRLEILIKAMWAINRRGKWSIRMKPLAIVIENMYGSNSYYFKDYNNSEQQALEKALEYIYEKHKP